MRFWNNCHRVRSKIKGLQKVFDSKKTNEHKQIDKIDYGDLCLREENHSVVLIIITLFEKFDTKHI